MCDHLEQSRSATERFALLVEELEALDVSEVDFERFEGQALSHLLTAMQHGAARLEAASLRALPVWNDREAWKADGARTGGAWLAEHAGMAGSTARERLRVADQLRSMPHTADAVASGRLGYSHAREFAKAAADPEHRRGIRRRREGLGRGGRGAAGG